MLCIRPGQAWDSGLQVSFWPCIFPGAPYQLPDLSFYTWLVDFYRECIPAHWPLWRGGRRIVIP